MKKPLLAKIEKEHQEIYQKLDHYLHELVKVKNERNDEHLFTTVKELLDYVKDLLEGHFKEEEQELFPEYPEEKTARLIEDHKEIQEKYQSLKQSYQELISSEDFDYKTQLLFPAYNLIATINHHAQREDRELS